MEQLLPQPKQAEERDDFLALSRILTFEQRPGTERALRFLERRFSSVGYEVRAVAPGTEATIRTRLGDSRVRPNGYQLKIEALGMEMVGSDEPALFYAACTLFQWFEIHLGFKSDPKEMVELPGLFVDDAPDFLHRGVMLDISRNRVPTVETVEILIDRLAGWKINQLQLYMEHTFAYAGHETVWQNASPWTAEEIQRLDAFCSERYVELVPNQNSFGHFHRWLVHKPYQELAECPEGVDHPFSPVPEPFSLCPIDSRSLDLLRDLYGQLLPHFSSRLFNVGLDETLDLGQGRSADLCEELGREQVYLQFLKAVHELTSGHGRRMMFWGDVILSRPELIDALPRDAIALEWGYEADHPFAEDAARFSASGLDFYVCPGTSSWNSLAGRVKNAVLNLASAARHGHEQGALGYLITDWGDHGHLQPLPVSYPGFVAGAAFAWSVASARHPEMVPLASWLDQHVYQDSAGRLGRLTLELGEVYRRAGGEPANGSVLFFLTFFGPEELARRKVGEVRPKHLREALAAVEQAAEGWEGASTEHAEWEIWSKELGWLIEMLRFACRFGIERLGGNGLSAKEGQAWLGVLRREFEDIWRQRSREGGLAASAARIEALKRWL